MEQPILSEPNQYPSEDVIFSHIGKSKSLWTSLFNYIHTSHPEFGQEWRYYRDGKSWLLKVTRKKKTIFWLSLIKHTFRTTFYFTDKAEEAILSSGLSEELKEQFRNRKSKISGVTIVYSGKGNVEDAKQLIGIKLRMK
jgi:hypothetical protein